MSATHFPQACGFSPATPLDLDALALFLRRRHRFGVSSAVSHATGIAEGTVENWLQRRSRPSLENFLRLAGVYGVPLIDAAWPSAPMSIRAAALHERALHLDEQIAAQRAELERLNVQIAGQIAGVR
jgi:transcriptional regulator with XRE-family HTH domain